MKKISLRKGYLLFFILLSVSVFAQSGKDGSLTVTNAFTVLNRYARIVSDVSAGSNSITVANINDLNRDGISYLPGGFVTNGASFSSNALAKGDLIILYQAQGASINSSNTIDYGAVTNLNGAGTYELIYVENVVGNAITLSCNAKSSYLVSRYSQVIRVPQYTTLTVNSGASVVAIPWGAPTFGGGSPSDPLRRRGGFNAIFADNIVNNGVIDANEAGFRGGTRENDTQPIGDGFYADFVTNSSFNSAEKGESIAGYREDYDAIGGRYGRGAAANGGGGGNSHNAGGGGGANGGDPLQWFRGAGLMNNFGSCGSPGAWAFDPEYIANGNALTNSSGGGRGGYTYGKLNVNACNFGPSYPKDYISLGVPAADVLVKAFEGDNRDVVGGLGGRPLVSANSQKQIFFGGGGGAGDGNDNASNDGGDGGGVVFIVVSNAITGTGSIQANGQKGFNTINNHNDAPGGGGGGGTILIQSTTINNGQVINANGGAGGSQLITNDESEGPGGGGGGGVLSIKATTDASAKTIAGGSNGTTTSTSVTEFPANGATSGNVGSILATPVTLNSPICQTVTTPNVVAGNICGPGIVNLSATGAVGETIEWFTSQTAVAPIFTGNNYSPNLSATTTFYVQSKLGSDVSARVPVVGSVYTAPPTVTLSASPANNVSSPLCLSTSVTITANGGADLFEFSVDGVVKQAMSSLRTYTTSSLTNGQVVSVRTRYAVTLDGNLSETAWGTGALEDNVLSAALSGNAADGYINSFKISPTEDKIVLGISGKAINYRRIMIFLDTKPGGFNVSNYGDENGSFPPVRAFNYFNENPSTFDSYFAADYCVAIATDAGEINYYADVIELKTGNSIKTYLGTAATGVPTSVMGINKNNAGINDNTLGFEVEVSKALIGYTTGDIKFFAFTMQDNDVTNYSVTNSFLSPERSSSSDYGNGAIDYNLREPNPVVVAGAALTPCYSTDSMTMSFASNPTPATVGSAQSKCILTSDPLGGNTPAIGTGLWTLKSGPGTVTFADDAIGNTIATVSVKGTYVFTWTIKSGQCATSSADISVVYNITNAPTTVSATQNFCKINTPKVSNLDATGNNVEWFLSATGGSALAIGTNLVTGSYYAEQTDATTLCKSITRLKVDVNVDNPAAPTGSGVQNVCNSGTIASLVATSTGSLLWYSSATGGSALSSSTVLVNGTTYYASQTVGGCESATRYPLTVTVTNPQIPFSGGSQSVCSSSPLQTLTANASVITGTVVWYDALINGNLVPSPKLNSVGSVTYYAQNTIGLCASTSRTAVVLEIKDSPFLKIVSSPCSLDLFTYTINFTAASGSVITRLPAVGTIVGNSISGIPSGTDISITASKGNGCDETINFTAPDCSCTPVDNAISGGNKSVCEGQSNPSLSVTVNAGETVDWFSSNSAGSPVSSGALNYTPSNTAVGVHTYYAQVRNNLDGCLSSGRTAVSLNITSQSAPIVGVITQPTCLTATGSVVLSGLPSGSWTINPGNIVGSTSSTTISGLAAAATFNYTVENSSGCTSPATVGVVVNAQPATPVSPVIGAITQPTITTPTGSFTITNFTVSNSYSFLPLGPSVSALGVVTASPGTYSLTVSANGCSDFVNFTIGIQPSAPIAVDDNYTVAEEGSVVLTPLDLDTDADLDTLIITKINGTVLVPGTLQVIPVTNGTVTVSTAGVITFAPALNYNGPVSFPYEITDGTTTATANELITVSPLNDSPIAVDDNYTVAEEGSVVLTPLDLDTDVDLDTLIITTINGIVLVPGTLQVIPVTNGTVTVSTAGVITFTPALNYNGPVSFPYEITDGKTTATANELITVSPSNDAPIAVDDNYTVAEEGSVVLTPLDLDTDADLDTLIITTINGIVLVPGTLQVIPVTNGTVTVSTAGVITFAPALNYNGPVSFPYEITDGTTTATANELITVSPLNDSPIAVDDNYTVAEEGSVVLTPLDLDTDVDLDTLIITTINGIVLVPGTLQVIPVTNGTVTVSTAGVITFTPALNYNGPVSFPYEITDGKTTATANELITVSPLNDAPIAVDDNYTVAEGGSVVLTPLDLDTDVDLDTLIITTINGIVLVPGTLQVIPVTNGTVTVSTAGVITFAPALNYNGPVSFPYEITDGTTTATANELISVSSVNESPIAVDGINANIPVTAGATAIDPLLATDGDGTIVSYTIISLPSNGVLSLSGIPIVVNQVLTPAEALQLKYDPNGLVIGNDTFTFTATDNENASDLSPATITIPVITTIDAVIDAPAVVNATGGTTPSLFVNDTVNGVPFLASAVTVSSLPLSAGLTLNPDGTVTVAPGTLPGTYPIIYTICQVANSSVCDTATSSVVVTTIDAVDDPTTIVNGAGGTTPSLFANDTLNGVSFLPSAVSVTSLPLATGLTLNANGTITVASGTTPGTYPITYTICQVANPLICDTATTSILVVTIAAVNDAPKPINEDGGTTPSIFINDTLDGSPFIPSDVILTSSPLPLGLTLNIDGTVTVAPMTTPGTYPITYTICQVANPSICSTAVVVVNVDETCENLVIHNAFSPNNDGINEWFQIDNIDQFCTVSNIVEIYNRWGVLVYETSNYDNNTRKFIGLSEGRVTVNKGEELPTGVYFYVVKWTATDGKSVDKAGYLYLTR